MGKKQKRDGKKSRSTRGRSVLEIANEALNRKEPFKLEWDQKTHEPIGEHAAKFASWCGIVAQKYVSCNLNVWGDLDAHVKEVILGKITGAFTVPEDRHHYCLSKAGTSWRSWKFRLRKLYMLNKQGEVQKSPPSDLYPNITQEDWTAFVAFHTSKGFKEISEKNKANIAKKQSVYTGSRGGYRKIKEKAILALKEKGIENPEIGRHEVWTLGHKDKDGKMKTPYDQGVYDRCLAYEKEHAEGKFKPSGTDDILGRAISKPEHPGRVRGVSSHVGITKVFGKSERRTSEYVKSLEHRVNDLETYLQGVGDIMWRLFVEEQELEDEDIDFLAKLRQLKKFAREEEDEEGHEEEEDEEGHEEEDDEEGHEYEEVEKEKEKETSVAREEKMGPR